MSVDTILGVSLVITAPLFGIQGVLFSLLGLGLLYIEHVRGEE